MPEFFDRYICQVKEDNLLDAMEQSIQNLDVLDLSYLEEIQHKNYAPGKWTVNEVFQHILDFERILSFRTLLFARNHPEPQPAIDEDDLARYSKANQRELRDILTELKAVRQTSLLLFLSFDEDSLQKTGMNWKYEVSVLAMGFNMVGHQNHHIKIIHERYSNLK